MSPLIALCASTFVVALLVRWYRSYTRYSVKYIRGPPNGSFLLGNVRDLSYQENVGDLDFKYLTEYGAVWKMQFPFGTDVLMIADPKALQHIMHKSGYNYAKTVQARVNIMNITGKGIIWAAGDAHVRQRKIMSPAFSSAQLRSFLPVFHQSANKLCQRLKDELSTQSSEGATISVSRWLSRTTLDVVGQAAFDYEFGALDSSKNELSEVYHNMFVDSTLHPSTWNTLFQAVWAYLPQPVLDYVRFIPTREYSRFLQSLKVVNKVSKTLIKQKSDMLLHGDKTSKDVMSVLVRANASEDPGTRLNDEEMISQMATLTLAGHDTTANTVTWLLWELAKNQDYQDKLRAEVAQKREEVTARGDVDFSMEDLDAMDYLQAAIKETLRYHNIVYHLNRAAVKDDVIPLTYPITTKTGKVITEIPVGAGQVIMPNIAVYNRLPEVWGEDSHTWNPMRHLEGNVDNRVRIGMFGNVMTFSAGVMGCLGWKFSVIEMQAIVSDLIENFKFSIPAEQPKIIRLPSGVMSPMVRGREKEGVLMPLHVVPV